MFKTTVNGEGQILLDVCHNLIMTRKLCMTESQIEAYLIENFPEINKFTVENGFGRSTLLERISNLIEKKVTGCAEILKCLDTRQERTKNYYLQ